MRDACSAHKINCGNYQVAVTDDPRAVTVVESLCGKSLVHHLDSCVVSRAPHRQTALARLHYKMQQSALLLALALGATSAFTRPAQRAASLLHRRAGEDGPKAGAYLEKDAEGLRAAAQTHHQSLAITNRGAKRTPHAAVDDAHGVAGTTSRSSTNRARARKSSSSERT